MRKRGNRAEKDLGNHGVIARLEEGSPASPILPFST